MGVCIFAFPSLYPAHPPAPRQLEGSLPLFIITEATDLFIHMTVGPFCHVF